MSEVDVSLLFLLEQFIASKGGKKRDGICMIEQ